MAARQQMIYTSPYDDWEIPRATLEWFGLGNSARTYLAFARVRKGTGNDTTTLLVSNYGSLLQANRGVALLQIFANSTGAFTMTATQIAPCQDAEARFGYYDGGDGYYYIGVYSAGYRDVLSVIPLGNPVRTGARGTSFGAYYGSTTAPDGWTEVPSFPYDEGIYASSITTLALMKSKMKTWISEMPVTSSRYVCMAISAFTPFTTGGTISVQINKSNASNYGTALITKYQNAAGAEVYSMSYYNGAWTDPKKLAFA